MPREKRLAIHQILRPSVAPSLLVAAQLLLGCEPTSATGEENRGRAEGRAHAEPSASSTSSASFDQADLGDLEARVVDFRYQGALCPERFAAAATLDPNGVAVSFDLGEVDALDSTTPVSGGCAGVVTLEVPAGYRFGQGFLCVRHYADNAALPGEVDELGTVEWKLGFKGGDSQSIRRSFSPGQPPDNGCLRLKPWSVCDASGRVELEFSVEATANAGQYVRVAGFALDLDAVEGEGAKWQSCDGTPLRRSAEKAYCGGINDIRCLEPFMCEIRDRSHEYPSGVCIGQDERLAKRGEPCPGNVLCESHLLCAGTMEQLAAGEGVCRSREDLNCNNGGIATCPEGYQCQPSGTCDLVDGTFLSSCSKERPCQTNFTCDFSVNRCKPIPAELGEACGKAVERSCSFRLTCTDPERGECRASRGEYRDYCDEETACDSKLVCTAHRCWKQNAPSGDKCTVPDECASWTCNKGECS